MSVLTLLLSGCANLSTISRSNDLPDGGKVIHLDASQRVVYADKAGAICAEPAPDALQSYAASLGASVGVTESSAKAISQAFGASSASIGLRTQSITLMRDTLYRICEYSHNEKSNPLDVVQLLQRSQDLTLGILAIEQITGAAVARQVALSSGASADVASGINNIRAQLDLAKKNEASKKTELAAASDAVAAQKTRLGDAKAALKAEQEKETPDADKVKSLTAAVTRETAALDQKTAEETDARTALERAVASSEAIGDMLAGALASSKSSTTGKAEFMEPAYRQASGASPISEVAKAAHDIVEVVVKKGHMTDICMNFMTRLPYRAVENSPALTTLVEQCAAVIKTNMQIGLGQKTSLSDDNDNPIFLRGKLDTNIKIFDEKKCDKECK